jgi:MFS family permease
MEVDLAYVEQDLGGTTVAWLGLGNALATAATAPFAGAISDLIGRRYVLLLGSVFIIVGSIVTGVAPHMDAAIAGMAIIGIGAGFTEVTATAAILELVPVNMRGFYIGLSWIVYIPFAPSQTYG